MKINFKDRLKILTIASAKVEEYSTAIEEYLVNFFGKTKYLYSRTNIYGQLLQVTKDIANILFFYHDDAVIENNVLTAQKEISVRHFAELSGYNVTRAIASQGVIRMELKPTFFSKFGTPVYIRKYANLNNSNNALIYLIDIKEDQKVVDSTSSNVYLSCIEGIVKQSTFTADGKKLFACLLNDTEVIESSHLRVMVNNEEFTRKDSLLDMTYNEKSYFVHVGFLEQYQIIFGNGINGYQLKKGDTVTVEYITTVGEYGNFDETIYPTFEFVSGVFDANGDQIDVKEHCTIVKESGFLMGSNGDSVDSLRKVVGYNSRGNILIDARSFEAYLSKYSFLSKIRVWTLDSNRRINHILLLPNVVQKLSSLEDYFTVPIDTFKITGEMKNNIIQNITQSELSYLTNELVWVEPVFLKYVALVYLEPDQEFSNNQEIFTLIKNALVNAFISVSFSRMTTTQDIAKSNIIAKIQEIVGESCRVSVIFVSQMNEEAKINGYYYTTEWKFNKKVETRIEVPFGTDPLVGLTERNDIDCRYEEEVPILRGGFKMLSNTGEKVMIDDAINLYIKENNDWTRI